jgi:hypothetical protein
MILSPLEHIGAYDGSFTHKRRRHLEWRLETLVQLPVAVVRAISFVLESKLGHPS